MIMCTFWARVHLPEVLPQKPLAEQQSPHSLPSQMALVSELDPQFPSIEIAPRLVADAAAVVEVF